MAGRAVQPLQETPGLGLLDHRGHAAAGAAESCSEYIYAVTITEEVGANAEELPVMIVEAANGFEMKTGEVS